MQVHCHRAIAAFQVGIAGENGQPPGRTVHGDAEHGKSAGGDRAVTESHAHLADQFPPGIEVGQPATKIERRMRERERASDDSDR